VASNGARNRANREPLAGRLGAIAPFYGAAPKPREAIRRLCPVVGSWPGKDFTTKAAGVLEAGLTAAGIPHDLKVYPGAKHSFFNDQCRNYHAAAAADSAYLAATERVRRAECRQELPQCWAA